ncbi:MAG: L-threonylcarbamoyladenylate synthase [Lachnospiraceae bacterium]|nr:L-threonylcarbamoyladenylate synthase [Lachnospiraceae bacterium]
MKTEIIKVDAQQPDEALLQHAGEIIKDGGLAAFPTETVYGLGGDALNPESSKKIYAAKGRPSDNPLIVHIADYEALYPIVKKIPPAAEKLAEKCWPGPLTMIFEKTELVPDETSGGLPTVAVRMPSHPVAAALIRLSGGYIAAPSANLSGRPSPTTAAHVIEDLSGRVEMIIDGGPVDIGLESTIVDFTEEVPVILRPGYINLRMLQEILGEVKLDPGLTAEGEQEGVRPKAPGMRYRHYAPKAPLTIVEGPDRAVIDRINELTEEAAAKGLKAGVIATAEHAGSYHAASVHTIGSRRDEDTIARNLFAILRDFDSEKMDILFSESLDTPRMGMAVMNRLLKAAGHQVMKVGDNDLNGGKL